MARYDAVVIGAGPNGLTLANYLLRCGAKVLVVEKRHEVGGSLLTEDFGGARYNLHALYIPLDAEMPPYQDLELEQYGCLFASPRAQATVHIRNFKPLTLYRDPKSSINSIRRLSAQDAKRFEHMHRDMETLNSEIMLPWIYNPPAKPRDYENWVNKRARGELLVVRALSPTQVLEHYGFEGEPLKLLLLYLGCMWGIRPDQKGVGHIFLFFLRGMLRASVVRGGTSLLASSLHKQIILRGGDVLVGAEVAGVITQNGVARGVVLADGRRVKARIVASTLDVQTTFQRLVKDKVPKRISEGIKNWQWDPWSLFLAHWTLKQRPRFKVALAGAASQSLIHLSGYGSVADFSRQLALCSRGQTKPAGIVSFPSFVDGSQAPPGLTVARFTTPAPYRLGKRNWDDFKEDFMADCFGEWSSLTSNVTEKTVVWKYAYPPTYIEMKLANCVNGSILQGAYIPTQLGYYRPNEECSSYRTPLKNLYLCGASAHPGGMVILAGGYNAASIIARDLGLRPWWKPRYPLR